MNQGSIVLALLTAATLGQPVAAAPMSWRIERQTDPATDLKICRVGSIGGNIAVFLSERLRPLSPTWSVVVGFDNTPGSLRYLRIERAIYQTDQEVFGRAKAAEIVERLKAPGEFVFEWAHGPDYSKQGGLYSTGNFAEQAQRCENWVAGAPT